MARIEHEHVEQLRALADASVALNSSLTVEEILQLTADAARSLIRGTRATVAIFAPDPRLRPLTATSPPLFAEGEPEPARLAARLTGRGRELGVLEVLDLREREFSERDDSVLTQLAQLASVAISNAQLYERERTIAQTLQRSLRPGGLPEVPGLSGGRALPPRGRERRAGRQLLRPLRGRRRRVRRPDRRRAGQRPGRGGGDRARPRHTLRCRRRLRAAAERCPHAPAQGAARPAQRQPVLHRRARAPADRQGPLAGRAGLRRPPTPACGAPGRPRRARRAARHAAGH